MSSQKEDWDAYVIRERDSERAAIDIGLSFVKTLVTVNSGAVIAILAFVGQRATYDGEASKILAVALLGSTKLFGAGLLCAVFDFLVAYFYQSGITTGLWASYAQRYSITPNSAVVWGKRISQVAIGPMILFALASFGFFMSGLWSAYSAYLNYFLSGVSAA